MKKITTAFILPFILCFLAYSSCEKSKKTVEPDENNHQEPGVPTLSISKQTAGFDEVYELSFSAEEAVSYVVQENMNPQFSNPRSFPADSTKKSFSYKVYSPTLFYYRVQGINGADTSGWSQVVSITVNPLERPSGFVSEEYCLSGQEYTLSWTPVTKAQSYTIEEAENQRFQNPTVLTAQDSLITITRDVQAIQHFYYRVKAVHEDFVSPWSDTLVIVILPLILSAPEFSISSLARNSGSAYTIYWTNTGLSYTLEEATNNDFLNADSYNTNNTSKTFCHFREEGTRYYYRVRAHGIPGQNDSPWSSTCEVKLMSMIAFVSDRDGNNEIYSMNDDGTDQRNLSNNSSDDRNPSWSPDGTQIAFQSHRIFQSYTYFNWEICVMDENGGNQRNITNRAYTDYNPSWSPDGSQIAFMSSINGNWQICVINMNGTDLRNLSDSQRSDVFPCWSPDGFQIAFSSSRDGNYDIYVMNTDGTDQRNITNSAGDDTNPSWSPDETQIAFTSYRDGNGEIYVMNADGTNQRNLTNDPSWDHVPTWSPDGSQIAFQSNRDINWEIYVINIDGTNLRNLTNNYANDTNPSWWCPR